MGELATLDAARHDVVVLLRIVLPITLAAVCASSATGLAAGHQMRGAASVRDSVVPLGGTAAVGAGWKLQVIRAIPNAVSYSGSYLDSLPSGVSVVMATIVLTYDGNNAGVVDALARRVYVNATPEDVYQAVQGAEGCAPRPARAVSVAAMRATLTYGNRRLRRGQSIRGRLCFEVAPRVVGGLKLYVDPPGCSTLVSVSCDRVRFVLWSKA